MTTNITPDKARKLLDGTTPGPWQSRGDGPSSGKPYLRVCTCDDRTHVAESVSWDNAPLIAAAPALAHLAANLHYEYAVLEDVGDWRQRGEWFDTFEEAADYRDVKREEAPMCIVRRLVGEPEVVE